MRYLANILSGSRLLLAPCLLAAEPFSPTFWVIYVYCGVSDMLDGSIARHSGSVSKRGALLDSLADLALALVCCIKLLPLLKLKSWIWLWLGLILLIKLSNLISGLICHRRLLFLHTPANKLIGLLIFLWLLTIPFCEPNISAPLLCVVASFSAIQEGHYIRTGKTEEYL